MEYNVNIQSKRDTAIPATICLPDNKDQMSLLLMAHGFCSNRDEDGAFSILARILMINGIASIRIDFPGCHDSKESYLANTIENDMDDLRSAYEYMTENYHISKTYIIGYSMGGKVAVHYIDKYKDIEAAVFFAPAITNGLDWSNSSLELGNIKKMNRAHLVAKKRGHYDYLNTFDNTHVPLSFEFIDQCLNYRTNDIFNGLTIPCLMIYGDKDDIIPEKIYQNIIENCNNPNFDHHLIKDANHGFGMWDNNIDQFAQLINTASAYLTSFNK